MKNEEKKKIKLDDIKVESFINSLEGEKILGGSDFESDVACMTAGCTAGAICYSQSHPYRCC